MIPESCVTSKPFIADLTNIRLFTVKTREKKCHGLELQIGSFNLPSMRSFVVLEMRRLAKSHSTGVATIWFLKVNQSASSGEIDLSWVTYLSTMNSHVILKINCFCEWWWALITFVILLPRMKLFMRPQAWVAREFSSTNVACEWLIISEKKKK